MTRVIQSLYVFWPSVRYFLHAKPCNLAAPRIFPLEIEIART
jgi:hypothetical protein